MCEQPSETLCAPCMDGWIDGDTLNVLYLRGTGRKREVEAEKSRALKCSQRLRLVQGTCQPGVRSRSLNSFELSLKHPRELEFGANVLEIEPR